jgi:hypothetical protein
MAYPKPKTDIVEILKIYPIECLRGNQWLGLLLSEESLVKLSCKLKGKFSSE